MGALKELMCAKNPAEMIALLKYARQAKSARKELTSELDPHWRYAYEALCNVSRSFALVIMQLENDLRHPICVFYLILRALDTVEDDTSVDGQLRQQICRKFWTFLPSTSLKLTNKKKSNNNNTLRRPRLLSSDAPAPSCEDDIGKEKKQQQQMNDEDFNDYVNNYNEDEFVPWTSSQFGTDAEKELCQKFNQVTQCFTELNPYYQQVIIHITKRMGSGMADHIDEVSCDTINDYDLYCHYVAGLVGYGLTDIFVISASLNNITTIPSSPSSSSSRSELSSLSELMDHSYLSNSMGLFLQKTNIIRDYLEDIIDGRTFWPKEIWSQYTSSLSELKEESNNKLALSVLNHMVADSLSHVSDCLKYMACIYKYHPKVFKFVAIPQVMAIATLNEVYNNKKIFKGVVKIRRSQTALLIQRTNNIQSVYQIFFNYSHKILSKIPDNDPNAVHTKSILNNIIDVCVPNIPSAPNLIIPNVLSIILFSALSSYVLKRRQEHFDGAVFTWRSAGGIMEPLDMLAVGALFLVCMYMFGFFLLPYMTNLHQDDWHRLQQLRVNVDPTSSVTGAAIANQNANNEQVDCNDVVHQNIVELDENGNPL